MHRSVPLLPHTHGGRVWRRGIFVAVAAAIFSAGVQSVRADEVTRRIQEELRKRNLYFGDVDGRPSPQLSTALHRYQERKGFSSTGETDADTLYSLNIARPGQTPPRLAASAPGSTVPPSLDTPEGGPAAFWPDITVLRSDEARPSLVSNEAKVAAAPTATPAPPPASANALRRPTVEQVQDFVTSYLRAGQNNDAEAELRFYGEPIAFYDEGTVDHTYIARAVARYDHRWPERHFVVIGPVAVTDSPDGSPTKFVVNFRLGFNVKNSRYAVGGKTDNTWTVSSHDPDGWKIVSMQEQRVREK